MWVTFAVVALLLLCVGLSYALGQAGQMDRRVRALLLAQATHTGELQRTLDALNETQTTPLAEVVPLQQLSPYRHGDRRI